MGEGPEVRPMVKITVEMDLYAFIILLVVLTPVLISATR
jgi:hypothetical protein